MIKLRFIIPMLAITFHYAVSQPLPTYYTNIEMEYKSLKSPSGQLDGLGALNSRLWEGVYPRSNINQNASVVNLAWGKFSYKRQIPVLNAIYASYSKSEINGNVIYHQNTDREVLNHVSGNLEQFCLSYRRQWVRQGLQPFIGFGILNRSKNFEDRFGYYDGIGWNWAGNPGSLTANIEKEITAATFDFGGSIQVARISDFRIETLVKIKMFIGNAEVFDNRESGVQNVEGFVWGVISQGSIAMSHPLNRISDNLIVRLKVSMNYESNFFRETPGASDEWYGTSVSLGLSKDF